MYQCRHQLTIIIKPRLHQQILCENFYVTILFARVCVNDIYLQGIYVANTFAEKLICQFVMQQRNIAIVLAYMTGHIYAI